MKAETFEAELEQLEPITHFIMSELKRLKAPTESLFALELVIEEIFVNIVNHAYGGNGGKILVELEDLEGGVAVTFVDRGKSFDPTASHKEIDADTPIEKRKPGGLGILLTQKLTNDLHYERVEGANHLRLVKYWKLSA